MEFREWLIEARLRGSAARQHDLGMQPGKPGYNPNVEMTNYQGWPIYFDNRVTVQAAKDAQVVGFFNWLADAGDLSSSIPVELVKRDLSADLAQTLKKIMQATRETNGDGTVSSSILYPSRNAGTPWSANRYVLAKELLAAIDLDYLNNSAELDATKEMYIDRLKRPFKSGSDDWRVIAEIIPTIEQLTQAPNDKVLQSQFERAMVAFYNRIKKNMASHVLSRSRLDQDALLQFLKDDMGYWFARDLWHLPVSIDSVQKMLTMYQKSGIEPIVGMLVEYIHKELRNVFTKITELSLVETNPDEVAADLMWFYGQAAQTVLNQVISIFTSQGGQTNHPVLAARLVKKIQEIQEGIKPKVHYEIDDLLRIFDAEHADSVEEVMRSVVSRALDAIGSLAWDLETNDPVAYDQWKRKAFDAAKRVIDTLHSLGLRKFLRKPIAFYHQHWSEKNDSYQISVGGYYHGDVIRVFGDHKSADFVNIVAHEIGHGVYDNLSYQDQVMVANMASSYPVTNYSNVDFVYPGKQKPVQAHTSGNEWFAEMLATLAAHPAGQANLLGQHQINYKDALPQFKKVFANQQQIGPGYKQVNPDKIAAKQGKWQQIAQNRMAKTLPSQ